MQSKKHSLLEVSLNIAMGFLLAMLTNYLILPVFGAHVSLSANFWITLVFTVVSFIRSYIFRRIFNRITHNGRLANNPVTVISDWRSETDAAWQTTQGPGTLCVCRCFDKGGSRRPYCDCTNVRSCPFNGLQN